MPTFEYQATDPSGSTVTGNAIGANLETVLADLSKRGLTVERINVARLAADPLAGVAFGGSNGAPVPARDTPPMERGRMETPSQPPFAATEPQSERSYQAQMPGPGMPGPEIPSAEMPGAEMGERSYVQTHLVGPVVGRAPLPAVGFFFRQLSTMLNAGVPIVQSLDTLTSQARDPRMKEITANATAVVKAGRPLSFALQRYPETITPVMLSLVRVGEEGGFLDEAAAQVSDYIDREIQLRHMYKRTTFYPKLVLVASFFIIGVTNTILASVAPGQKGLESPLGLGTWITLGLFGFFIWLFLRVGLANPRIKHNWDSMVLRIPVLGHTMHQLAMARFGRAFGAMYKAGVPLTKAMPLAADACGNEYLRARMYPSFRRMGEGAGIHETLISTGAFSPIVLDMVSTGEKTGNMEQMVTKVSEYYEQEAETRQNTLAAVTGVVVFLIVAVYVGYMVVKFYSGHYGGMMQESTAGTESFLWLR